MSGTDISATNELFSLKRTHIHTHNAQTNAMTRDGGILIGAHSRHRESCCLHAEQFTSFQVSVSLKEMEVCVHHALSLHLHTKHYTTPHPFY